MNPPADVDIGSAQIRAAEIDCADQLVLGAVIHALCFSSPEHIETDRGDQYSAFDHVLGPALNIQE